MIFTWIITSSQSDFSRHVTGLELTMVTNWQLCLSILCKVYSYAVDLLWHGTHFDRKNSSFLAKQVSNIRGGLSTVWWSVLTHVWREYKYVSSTSRLASLTASRMKRLVKLFLSAPGQKAHNTKDMIRKTNKYVSLYSPQMRN